MEKRKAFTRDKSEDRTCLRIGSCLARMYLVLIIIKHIVASIDQMCRDLKQRRRRRQREPQKKIVLISKTLALHVRYTLWYISLSSSAKQQREMTKFNLLWRT